MMANIACRNTPGAILRMEVWVTNRNGTTTETRDIVGLANLAEGGRLTCLMLPPPLYYSRLPVTRPAETLPWLPAGYWLWAESCTGF